MDINFEYYKVFYYVVKYGNFTKAAGVMKNSQPNITRMINSLEHELQCTLFIRTNRGVKLTTEGEKLYNRVSAAIQRFYSTLPITPKIIFTHLNVQNTRSIFGFSVPPYCR